MDFVVIKIDTAVIRGKKNANEEKIKSLNNKHESNFNNK